MDGWIMVHFNARKRDHYVKRTAEEIVRKLEKRGIQGQQEAVT